MNDSMINLLVDVNGKEEVFVIEIRVLYENCLSNVGQFRRQPGHVLLKNVFIELPMGYKVSVSYVWCCNKVLQSVENVDWCRHFTKIVFRWLKSSIATQIPDPAKVIL